MRVTLIAAQSLDGRLTFHDEKGAGFASEADQQYFRKALAGFDCSIMGGETYRVSSERIQQRAHEDATGLAAARPAPGRLRIIMTRRPAAEWEQEAVPGTLEFTSATPPNVVNGLRARGCRSCVVLGGGEINGEFLAAGLVDEVWLTLEPRIFGAGVPLAGQAVDIQLKLNNCEPLSANTLLVKYEVVK